jgi:hypothetical protein
MKTRITGIGLAALIMLAGITVQAQTTTTTVTNVVNGTNVTITTTTTQIQQMVNQAIQLPAGVNLPAMSSTGLCFTNVTYKVATGLEYESSGGTMSYIQGDADLYKTSLVDLGAGAEMTLNGTGAGLYSAAADVEFIKNLSNFQVVGKVGAGGVFEGKHGAFFEVGGDINYNLAQGTGSTFLGGQSWFTYVFGGIDLRFHNAGVIEKLFRVGAGVAF